MLTFRDLKAGTTKLRYSYFTRFGAWWFLFFFSVKKKERKKGDFGSSWRSSLKGFIWYTLSWELIITKLPLELCSFLRGREGNGRKPCWHSCRQMERMKRKIFGCENCCKARHGTPIMHADLPLIYVVKVMTLALWKEIRYFSVW